MNVKQVSAYCWGLIVSFQKARLWAQHIGSELDITSWGRGGGWWTWPCNYIVTLPRKLPCSWQDDTDTLSMGATWAEKDVDFLHGNVCSLSHFSHVRLFVTLWTIAFQAPQSMGFSKQEYWSRLSCSPPGARSHPGIEPASPALQVDSLQLSHWGSCVGFPHSNTLGQIHRISFLKIRIGQVLKIMFSSNNTV